MSLFNMYCYVSSIYTPMSAPTVCLQYQVVLELDNKLTIDPCYRIHSRILGLFICQSTYCNIYY